MRISIDDGICHSFSIFEKQIRLKQAVLILRRSYRFGRRTSLNINPATKSVSSKDTMIFLKTRDFSFWPHEGVLVFTGRGPMLLLEGRSNFEHYKIKWWNAGTIRRLSL